VTRPDHPQEGITLAMTAERLYSQVEVAAGDVAEVIAFVVSRPRRLAIHEILLRPAGQEH
jgi:NADP-dependent 3-hydroxy acid dehydrogenase YdfG